MERQGEIEKRLGTTKKAREIHGETGCERETRKNKD